MNESRITFAQQGVYIDSILNPGDLQYNNPKAVTFPQGITAERVCKATEAMLENHPVFFSHFEDRGGEVYQVYATASTVTVKKGALEEARKAFVRPFDIQQGPLCRAEVIDAEQGVVLLLDMHHLVYDGASLDVMLREICTLLQGGEIVAERHSYAEYAESQPSDLSDYKTFYDQLFPQGAKATQIAGDLGGGEGPHAEEEQPVSTPEVMARAKDLKSFGSCDKHIQAFFPAGEPIGIGILLEVTAADGWFYVVFMQDWREDVYFNAFLKEIVSLNLDFDLLYSFEAKAPTFSLK